MIEINHLCKSFGTLEVLKNITLEIHSGEIYGLVGRSGAGKSTLLRCINGLESYDSGSLKVDGTEVSTLSKRELRELRKGIGMIFQQFSLVERRNVYKNIALPMKCWKYDRNMIDQRIHELLNLVDLADKIYDRPSTLSGGQKQRVAIARALALDSRILLCDEATSALDPKTTQSVLNLLREINQKLGITIIIVTHQMEVVRAACDTISILEDGKIAASGDVKKIFLQKPQALMTLLGTVQNTSAYSGETISFFLSADKLDMIPVLSSQYHTSILSANTNDYKGTSFTEITVGVDSDHAAGIKQFLDREKILWDSRGGNQ